MPSDSEITFAHHAGRFYARRYGMAPMAGLDHPRVSVVWEGIRRQHAADVDQAPR